MIAPKYAQMLTRTVLKEYLKALASLYFDISDLLRGISVVLGGILFPGIQISFRNKITLKPL